MSKLILVALFLAAFVCAAMGESAVETLKAKVEAGEGAAPCDKAPSGPAPPRQFLDQRLPHVVDDYHPPVGGFNPTDIPSKEVDVAARKILREIEAAEAEAKANGDAPAPADDNGVISTEEHKALKQLLLDSDILVRAAAKALGENGPITISAKAVAKSAVKKAAKAEKKVAAKKAAKAAKAAKKATIQGKKLAAVKQAPGKAAASKKASTAGRPQVKGAAPTKAALSKKTQTRPAPTA